MSQELPNKVAFATAQQVAPTQDYIEFMTQYQEARAAAKTSSDLPNKPVCTWCLHCSFHTNSDNYTHYMCKLDNTSVSLYSPICHSFVDGLDMDFDDRRPFTLYNLDLYDNLYDDLQESIRAGIVDDIRKEMMQNIAPALYAELKNDIMYDIEDTLERIKKDCKQISFFWADTIAEGLSDDEKAECENNPVPSVEWD